MLACDTKSLKPFGQGLPTSQATLTKLFTQTNALLKTAPCTIPGWKNKVQESRTKLVSEI